MSDGSDPSAADQDGSRCRENPAAARAHWCFRWAVGATTTSRDGRLPSSWRAAVSANVVLPAPGVATARKSRLGEATKPSRAAFCQRRSRTVRVISRIAPERPTAPTTRPTTIAGPPVVAATARARPSEWRVPIENFMLVADFWSAPPLRSFAPHVDCGSHRARGASKSRLPPETGRGRPQGPGRTVSGGGG